MAPHPVRLCVGSLGPKKVKVIGEGKGGEVWFEIKRGTDAGGGQETRSKMFPELWFYLPEEKKIPPADKLINEKFCLIS